MFFIAFLLLSSLAIAASAAFFSVYGLTQLFAGAVIPIMIMGSSLEAGKLMAASFLYRHWKDCSIALKGILFSSIIILMLITSLGIFGYLTAAYQKDSIPVKELSQKLNDNINERNQLNERKKAIDDQISQLPNNYVNARKSLMNSFKPELDKINPRLDFLNKEITELQTKQLTTEAHIGPIMFVAKALNREPDEAVFYFTLLLMSVFDPLAVTLTLATNIAIRKYTDNKKLIKDSKQNIKETSINSILPSETEVIQTTSVSESPIPPPIPSPTPSATNELWTKEKIEEASKINNPTSDEISDIVKSMVDKKMTSLDKRQSLIAATRK